MATNNDIPVIKTFIYKNKYFVYDAYKNQILELSKEHFREVELLLDYGTIKYQESNNSTKQHKEVEQLIKKGYFRGAFIEKIQHPDTDFAGSIVDRCINDITFQVTKNCNFLCRYCMYAAPNNIERDHENVNMPWSVAHKAIDFLLQHSCDAEILVVSFYGGEPLLNFNLIVNIVEYLERKIHTKRIIYNTTVNGSLLSNNVIDFLVKHNFRLAISLDGCEEIQNRHRKFKGDGSPTYDIVFNNILNLKNKYPEYFNTHVKFVPVGFKDEKFENVVNFFEVLGVPEERLICLPADMEGIDYIESNIPETVNIDQKSVNTDKENERIVDNKALILLREIYNKKNIIPSQWHHNGPCIAGFKRLFVDASGKLFPCEKVLEREEFQIGDIYSGINIDKVKELMNIGKITEKECKSCWALRFCSMCASSCNDIEECSLTYTQKINQCKIQKEKALFFLKYLVDEMSKNG